MEFERGGASASPLAEKSQRGLGRLVSEKKQTNLMIKALQALSSENSEEARKG